MGFLKFLIIASFLSSMSYASDTCQKAFTGTYHFDFPNGIPVKIISIGEFYRDETVKTNMSRMDLIITKICSSIGLNTHQWRPNGAGISVGVANATIEFIASCDENCTLDGSFGQSSIGSITHYPL